MDVYKRKRVCNSCGHEFLTWESAVDPVKTKRLIKSLEESARSLLGEIAGGDYYGNEKRLEAD